MLDHKIDKIFRFFFLFGLLITLASFFYRRWFIISSGIGLALMVMTTMREGFKLRKADTFTNMVKMNKEKLIYRWVLTIIAAAVVGYAFYAKLFSVKAQFLNLTASPLYLNWWVIIPLGLVIGLAIVMVIAKTTGFESKQQAPKTGHDKTKNGKNKEKTIFLRFKEKLASLKPKKTAKHDKHEKKSAKEMEAGNKQKNLYRIFTMLAYFLAVICLIALLLLNKKAKIRFLDWYGWITLAILVGLFFAFSFLRTYKGYIKKQIDMKKEKAETISMIKKSVVARANKYKTDIDRLYELINQKGKLTISEISEGFGISKEMAEEWGKILEEHNLITLNYPPFGELELCKK